MSVITENWLRRSALGSSAECKAHAARTRSHSQTMKAIAPNYL
ncbi:hypothetical protein [Aetokthonos hydrillicola]|nr:hypothetical protein [Aetokthonos hydrillicola]